MFVRTLSCSVLAAFAYAGASHADEADESQYAIRFEGDRTRAEVAAEAARVPRSRSTEPAGSRVAPALRRSVPAEIVRAEAVRAVRLGLTTRGEI